MKIHDTHALAIIFSWLVMLIYFSSFIPQIILNFRLKTAKGMSELMLLGFFTGYPCEIIYAFCFNLPLSYKVFTPLSTIAVIMIVFQRFYYEKKKKELKKINIYLLIAAILVISSIFAYLNPEFFGIYFGWISTSIWIMYQIPQLIKIYRDKSTRGFSFMLTSLTALGCTLEFIAAILLKLPYPTLINGLKGIIIYIMFVILYLKYSTPEEFVE